MRKGQTLVETALILPVILLLLTGIIDFGLLFNNYLVISNATRNAARSASVGKSDAYINGLINTMTANLDGNKIQINISPIDGVRKKDDEVTITIVYSHTFLTPIISALLPGPINLQSKTVMRAE